MHVEDLADAIKFIMELSKDEYQNAAYQKVLINVGSNEETTIENLAQIICKETGYRGKLSLILHTQMARQESLWIPQG